MKRYKEVNKNEFIGFDTKTKKEIRMGQDSNGMYYGRIKDLIIYF